MFQDYTYRCAVDDTYLCQAGQSSRIRFGFCYVDADKNEVVQIAQFMKCREYFNDWIYTAVTGNDTSIYRYDTSVSRTACGDHDGLAYFLVTADDKAELDNVFDRFTTIKNIWPEAEIYRVDHFAAKWNEVVSEGDEASGMLLVKVPEWVYKDTVSIGIFTALIRMSGYESAQFVEQLGIWYLSRSSEASAIHKAARIYNSQITYYPDRFAALVARPDDSALFSAFADGILWDDEYVDAAGDVIECGSPSEAIHEWSGPSCVTSCGMAYDAFASSGKPCNGVDAIDTYTEARVDAIMSAFNNIKQEAA